MNAILSIRKEFSQKIMSGEKLYEFRKNAPFKAERIFIYETAPTKRIVGSFTFEVIKDNPKNLWKRFGSVAGIDEKRFFEYYSGFDYGYALKVIDLIKEDINPFAVMIHFKPPQSFIYTDEL